MTGAFERNHEENDYSFLDKGNEEAYKEFLKRLKEKKDE